MCVLYRASRSLYGSRHEVGSPSSKKNPSCLGTTSYHVFDGPSNTHDTVHPVFLFLKLWLIMDIRISTLKWFEILRPWRFKVVISNIYFRHLKWLEMNSISNYGRLNIITSLGCKVRIVRASSYVDSKKNLVVIATMEYSTFERWSNWLWIRSMSNSDDLYNSMDSLLYYKPSQ